MGRAIVGAGAIWLVTVGCRAPAPSTAPSPGEAAPYAGATTCGAPVPAPRPRLQAQPAVEPMPWHADAPPAPPPPAPDPDGEVSPSVLAAAVRAALPELQGCAQRFFAHDDDGGPVHVDTRVAFDAEGRVEGAEVRGVDAELDRCVCDVITTLAVGSTGGRAVVSYPFIMGR